MAKNDVGEDTTQGLGTGLSTSQVIHGTPTSKYIPTRRPDVIVWCTEVVPWSVID